MLNRIMLILFISSELCYYLLIAQTGIVESFGSDIYAIVWLPIGGVIGSYISYYLKGNNALKIILFLLVQLFSSFYYPDFSHTMLFVLGISVGAMAPLVIETLKQTSKMELGTILAISYIVGVSLFNYEATKRIDLAIILTIITLFSSLFLPNAIMNIPKGVAYSLFTMVLWVFLDSALFESLSRDLSVPIWRGGYEVELILFHILGVVLALNIKIQKHHNELLIAVLFAFSYLSYFLQEAYALSIVYPFVISYYNVLILKTLIQKEFKYIATSMIFIGWIGSGAGLFLALHDLIFYMPLLFLIGFIKIVITHIREENYV